MPDRLAELAVLMRNETKEVRRLGRIRLRLKDTPAKLLRLRQTPFALATAGERERLAQ
jgi:hypothetical protein